MIYKLIYAVNSDNKNIIQQFENRLSIANIYTKQLKSSDKYSYFEASWDDANVPTLHLRNSNSKNAGAKPKQLVHDGKPVSCGFIYTLRHTKNLSDAEIGLIFDVSESTIARRRKRHLSDGSFYENSNIIF